MCGRYALGIRASFVRHQLQDHGMPVDEAPEDDEVRQSYNFAPGYHGLVYRADVPDYGAGPRHINREHGQQIVEEPIEQIENRSETRYKLQAMKWGLVPFWTKRNPDYGAVMKTINARDDSLAENRGMWNTMKQKKRCIIVAQGFFEWLKKNGGKEKIPHYVKRKDDQLMCFAGLWDCVQYDGAEEKHYTYTIITTDSNKQLKFLHDRMPVILENGSEQIRTWLDPNRYAWSKELQALLKPFEGELECYPVSQEVGKVGNNSPAFIVPVASSENKSNIANFFSGPKASPKKGKLESKAMPSLAKDENLKDAIKKEDDRVTVDGPSTEDNAPVPVPVSEVSRLKRERENTESEDGMIGTVDVSPLRKIPKSELKSAVQTTDESREIAKMQNKKKTRSATSNRTTAKITPSKASDGSQRITNFFIK
ncbi:hypothetical protein MMC18_004116 [Xylographa bjoerkii]|nr:hypothetical protein [Xylographa bjoerkii]